MELAACMWSEHNFRETSILVIQIPSYIVDALPYVGTTFGILKISWSIDFILDMM